MRRADQTGGYVADDRDQRHFHAGLATVHIDRETDAGDYWEPNIWIIRPLIGATPR